MRNALLALGFLITALALAAPGAVLAGKSKAGEEGTWKVKATPDAASAAKGGQEFEDTLNLRKGKFLSAAGAAEGFVEAPYRVEANHWMSDAVSRKEGTKHWHGEVTGDSVEGQITWIRSDGAVLNYTFTGTRTGEPSQTRPAPKTGN